MTENLVLEILKRIREGQVALRNEIVDLRRERRDGLGAVNTELAVLNGHLSSLLSAHTPQSGRINPDSGVSPDVVNFTGLAILGSGYPPP